MIRACSTLLSLFVLSGAVMLGGCAQAPTFAASPPPPATGPLPVIKPLNEVLAAAGDPVVQDTDAAVLQSRAAALQGRAGRLAGTQTDAATQARLHAALAAKGG